MSLPRKDFRPALDDLTHRRLTRIARARGVSIQDLGRDIIVEYVDRVMHEAKVILGQDDDNPRAVEPRGSAVEPDGPAVEDTGKPRSARR